MAFRIFLGKAGTLAITRNVVAEVITNIMLRSVCMVVRYLIPSKESRTISLVILLALH